MFHPFSAGAQSEVAQLRGSAWLFTHIGCFWILSLAHTHKKTHLRAVIKILLTQFDAIAAPVSVSDG